MKHKLDFVKAGEEWDIPDMTLETHEEVLEQMTQYEKLSETEYNRLFNKYLVAVQLNKVDPSKTVDEYANLVKKMHPDDYLDLFTKIWNSGRMRKGSFRGEEGKNEGK